MNHIYDVIKRPVVTEKTENAGAADGAMRYAFEVSVGANKHSIREAIERAFGVKVASVNTMIMHGKTKRFGRTLGRRSSWKKAIVTLRPGHRIDLFPEEIEEPEATEEDA